MEQACCTDSGAMELKARRSRRDDALSNTTWGAGLLWGALVWLLHETGILAASGTSLAPMALFFLGFGMMVSVAIAVTLLVPGFKHADFFSYVLAGAAIGAGLTSWTYAWPAVLAVLGVVMIAASARQLRVTD